MLEDSIGSSPQKNKRSIHTARMHRKNRRQRALKDTSTLTQTVSNEIDATMNVSAIDGTEQESKTILSDLYWEESQITANLNYTFRSQNPKRSDFDPFEDEMMLAVADRLDCVRDVRSTQFAAQSKSPKGFIKCSQLMEEIIRQPSSSPTRSCNALIEKTTKIDFDITESEFLHCCEKKQVPVDDSINDAIPSTTAHTNEKSIVESILEDFCASPESPKSIQIDYSHTYIPPTTLANEEDRTPIFKFKNRQLRTYSRRKNVARVNIAERVENVAFATTDPDGNESSSSSVLSVQEDLTQTSPHALEAVQLNCSVNICDNLLNLSTYFSQRSSPNGASPQRESEEIIHSSPQGNESSNEEVLNRSVVEDDDLRFRSPKVKQPLKSSQVSSINASTDPSKLQHSVRSPKLRNYKSAEIEEELFADMEEEHDWNDECDFFKNYNTQDIFQISGPGRAANDGFQGFMTASQKAIKVSENAKHRAAQMIAEIDVELQNDYKATQNICVLSQTGKSVGTNRGAGYAGLQAVCENVDMENENRNKPLDIATSELANIQLSEWLIDDSDEKIDSEYIPLACEHTKIPYVTETEKLKLAEKMDDLCHLKERGTSSLMISCSKDNIARNENNSASLKTTSDTEEPRPAFIGFLTASQKPIEISAEAKAKAVKLLETLPQFPKGVQNEMEEADRSLFGMDILEDCVDKSPNELKTCPELKLQTKASHIESCSKHSLGLGQKHYDSTKASDEEDAFPTFIGFLTAFQKPIEISAEAKAKAAKLLETLPEFPKGVQNEMEEADRSLFGMDILEDCAEKSPNDLKMCPDLKVQTKASHIESCSKHSLGLGQKHYDSTKVSDEEDAFPAFIGFLTASQKPIEISAEAKAKAAKILETLPEFPKAIPEEEVDRTLVDDETATNETTACPDFNPQKKLSHIASRRQDSIENEQKYYDSIKNTSNTDEAPFTGFLTASQKPIEVSAEAKLKAAKLLETLPEFPKGNPNELMESDASLCRNNTLTLCKNASLAETKRKLEQEDVSVEGISEQPAKIVKSSTSSVRTPLAAFCDNSPLSSGSLNEDPAMLSFKRSASRKNLLSLNRRKRIKTKETSVGIQSANIENASLTVTPNKTTLPNILNQVTPITPNVNDFFAAVPDASTPHVDHVNKKQTLDSGIKTKATENVNEMDADFKHIEWDMCNDSVKFNKNELSSISILEQTDTTLNPSQIRMESLCRSGNPPPVSPIVISKRNNCRPSGLRRGRSMTKHN